MLELLQISSNETWNQPYHTLRTPENPYLRKHIPCLSLLHRIVGTLHPLFLYRSWSLHGPCCQPETRLAVRALAALRPAVVHCLPPAASLPPSCNSARHVANIWRRLHMHIATESGQKWAVRLLDTLDINLTSLDNAWLTEHIWTYTSRTPK